MSTKLLTLHKNKAEEYIVTDIKIKTNDSLNINQNMPLQNKKEEIKLYIKNLSEEQKIKFWIKTLLSSYNIFPEIIKTVDKIIELQASSVSFATDIYNGDHTALYQIERVIDLTERKNSLLNAHVMTKEIIKTLDDNDFEFLEKRYVYNWNCEDLAREFDISVRTVYRKIDRLINDIYLKLKQKNWSLKFLESQLKNEFWIKEKFIKIASEYFKNSNYNQHA